MQDSPHLELTDDLPRILADGDAHALETYLERLTPMQTARALSRLSAREKQRLVALLSPEEVAEVISDLPDEQAADFLEDMRPEQAAAVVQEMKGDQQADLLGEIREDAAEKILSHFSPADAREARTLMEYPGDSAGGLMHLEFLSYPETLPVRDVAEDLRANGLKYSDYAVQYLFVTDQESRLAGVLRLRDLVLSPGFRTVGQVMIPSPKKLNLNDSLDTIIAFF